MAFKTKTRRNHILNRLRAIIDQGAGWAVVAANARAFADNYARNHSRVTERLLIEGWGKRVPESFRGDANASKRLAIKAAMMLAWAIADDIEYKEQMREWLIDKTEAEIENAVRWLWDYKPVLELRKANDLPGKMGDLNNHTLNFLKLYALGPEFAGGGGNLPNPFNDGGTLNIREWNTADLEVHSELKTANVRVLCLVWHKAAAGATNHYYLPWADRRITKVQLSGVAAAPSLFFTDHLKGCSVFIRGPAANPTVYHAGLTGDFPATFSDLLNDHLPAADPLAADPAPPARARLQTALGLANRVQGACDYWHHLAQFRMLLNDAAMANVVEVNKTDYGDTNANVMQNIYNRIGTALQRKNKPGINQVQEGFGCVFGIRGAAGWTFYLQKKAMLKTYGDRGQTVTMSVPVCIERIFPAPRATIWDGSNQLLPIAVSDNDIAI